MHEIPACIKDSEIIGITRVPNELQGEYKGDGGKHVVNTNGKKYERRLITTYVVADE